MAVPPPLLAVESRMPTYEYMCRECGENFEVWQSFSDKPLKKHDDCGGELKKVFHARGIVFKGSGFYATDSKSSTASKVPSKPDSTKADNKSSGSKTTSKSSTSTSKSD